MKITFIFPSMGRKQDDKKFVPTWQMEPLSAAIIKARTPKDIEFEFYDDRVESIDFSKQTDLVAMTTECYSARRSYEIAKKYQDRGIPVIMGGFQPTLVPEEVSQYADHVVIGEVENIWDEIIDDFRSHRLKKSYESKLPANVVQNFPDRSIYRGKKYLKLGLIESARGCRYKCDFCSIAPFYSNGYNPRPIDDIIQEIRETNYGYYFFVDDNIVADPQRAKALFEALVPLKIRWFTQGSLHMAQDPALLKLMHQSGCEGLLIGFESLNPEVLSSMKKGFNAAIGIDEGIRKIHQSGLKIYATFVFGYDLDTPDSFEKTFEFALKHKFFLAAFNHLVPFPGTPLFQRLEKENRLRFGRWWLNHDYHFGQIAFEPKNYSSAQLEQLCLKYRRKFHSPSSIFGRLWSPNNFRSLASPYAFLFVNYISGRDVNFRQGIPMGFGEPISQTPLNLI